MNIYYLTQSENTGYDTYDSCIVVAESAEEARNIRPPGSGTWNDDIFSTWATKTVNVEVELIGSTKILSTGCVLASFNAG